MEFFVPLARCRLSKAWPASTIWPKIWLKIGLIQRRRNASDVEVAGHSGAIRTFYEKSMTHFFHDYILFRYSSARRMPLCRFTFRWEKNCGNCWTTFAATDVHMKLFTFWRRLSISWRTDSLTFTLMLTRKWQRFWTRDGSMILPISKRANGRKSSLI